MNDRQTMSDTDLANIYAISVRKLLDQICEVMNQARGVDNMSINFMIGMTDGRSHVSQLTVEKIVKLVG